MGKAPSKVCEKSGVEIRNSRNERIEFFIIDIWFLASTNMHYPGLKHVAMVKYLFAIQLLLLGHYYTNGKQTILIYS
jgi:hypothetical protein